MWEKYGRAREATNDNIIWRMRFSGRVTEATNTQSEYVIIFLHVQNIDADTPQSYVIRPLPFLLTFYMCI
jgi:hypothetical protein